MERDLLASGHRLVAGMDEVGRGALAGPVSVGVVVVDQSTGRIPAGLRDSKLLPAHVRQRLCEPIRRWCRASAVGHADAAEIDEVGLTAALRLAGKRALAAVIAQGVHPSAVILDGHHDWLTGTAPRGAPPAAPDPDIHGASPAPAAAFEQADALLPLTDVPDAAPTGTWPGWFAGEAPVVHTRIKADLQCASVAAASVLAKCERDELMVNLHQEHPEFAWAENKGYAAPEHMNALRMHGPTRWHRRSWALPGTEAHVQQGMMDL